MLFYIENKIKIKNKNIPKSKNQYKRLLSFQLNNNLTHNEKLIFGFF